MGAFKQAQQNQQGAFAKAKQAQINAKPSFGKSIVRGLLKTPARLTTNLIQAGQFATGKPLTQPFTGGLLGQVKPIGVGGSFGQNVLSSIGAGVEMASYIPVVRGVSSVAKATLAGKIGQGAIRGLTEGGVGGILGGTGSAMAENKPFGETLAQGIIGGLAGGTLGLGLGAIAPLAGKALGIKPKINVDELRKEVIESTSKALGISGKRTGTMAISQPREYALGLATIRKYADNFDPNTSTDLFDDTLKGLVTAKDKIFKTYDDIANQAGKQGVEIDLRPLESNLRKYITGITTQPKRLRAERILVELKNNFPNGKVKPSDFQAYIQLLNEELGGLTGGAEKGAVGVTADFTRQARELMDDAISRTGKEYQFFRNEYKSLATIEKNLVSQYQKALRKKGTGLSGYADLISGSEMINGIISGNPGLMTQSIAVRLGAKYIRAINDPETWLRRAFKGIDSVEELFTTAKRTGGQALLPEGKIGADTFSPLPMKSPLGAGVKYEPMAQKINRVIPENQKLLPTAVGKSQGVPIRLGSRSQSTIDAQEIARIQSQRSNALNTALPTTTPTMMAKTVNKNPISKSIPQKTAVGKGTIPENSLISEAKKYKSAEEFVKAQLDKNSYVMSVNKKVYRGEGKGIGNSTLVDGQYFADSKEFASQFGDVSESVIPKGSKVFDLDKIKSGGGIIPDEMLVDNKALTKYLIDNGFDYTRNTNTRGVEFVKLNKISNELESLASKSQSLTDFKKKVMANYDKYRDELARISQNYTTADNSRLRSPIDDIYNKVENKGIPKTKSQLTDIWNKANK